MKKSSYYIIWEIGDSDTISADTLFQAAVLGIAKRINDGKSTLIYTIKDERGNVYKYTLSGYAVEITPYI